MTQEEVANYNEMLKQARHLGFITQTSLQTDEYVKSASEKEQQVSGYYNLYSQKDAARVEKFASLRKAIVG